MAEITEDMIERAARALWAGHGLNGEWDSGTHEMHEDCREDARNALIAAAGVAPQEPSECSNPQCPLQRAHSGPCAPKGWASDREKLGAVRERLARTLFIASDDFAFAERMAKAWDAPGPHGRQRWYNYADSVLRAFPALATPVAVDEAKLAEVIDDSFQQRRPYEGIAAGAARRAIERQSEWLGGGDR